MIKIKVKSKGEAHYTCDPISKRAKRSVRKEKKRKQMESCQLVCFITHPNKTLKPKQTFQQLTTRQKQ